MVFVCEIVEAPTEEQIEQVRTSVSWSTVPNCRRTLLPLASTRKLPAYPENMRLRRACYSSPTVIGQPRMCRPTAVSGRWLLRDEAAVRAADVSRRQARQATGGADHRRGALPRLFVACASIPTRRACRPLSISTASWDFTRSASDPVRSGARTLMYMELTLTALSVRWSVRTLVPRVMLANSASAEELPLPASQTPIVTMQSPPMATSFQDA